MRIATSVAALLFVLQACSTTGPTESPYQQPNVLMGSEITKRIEQIPYQHRDELLQNLVWLVQQGEQSIPATLEGLRNADPKVRSSCAWVLGRMHDRRTIPNLQVAMKDSEPGVRLEVARSLVAMGDLAQSPVLIEGLDSDKKEVRYMCHETLKASTGRDFGYDHLNSNETELRLSVLRWRQWWGEYSGDALFAQSYQTKYQLLNAVAAPVGETKPATDGQTPSATPNPQDQDQQPQGSGTQGNGAGSTNGTTGTSGTTGTTGTNGSTGTNGTTGTNGATGTSGSTGTNGATGTSGSTGTNGTNGTTGTSNSSRPNGG